MTKEDLRECFWSFIKYLFWRGKDDWILRQLHKVFWNSTYRHLFYECYLSKIQGTLNWGNQTIEYQRQLADNFPHWAISYSIGKSNILMLKVVPPCSERRLLNMHALVITTYSTLTVASHPELYPKAITALISSYFKHPHDFSITNPTFAEGLWCTEHSSKSWEVIDQYTIVPDFKGHSVRWKEQKENQQLKSFAQWDGGGKGGMLRGPEEDGLLQTVRRCSGKFGGVWAESRGTNGTWLKKGRQIIPKGATSKGPECNESMGQWENHEQHWIKEWVVVVGEVTGKEPGHECTLCNFPLGSQHLEE